MLDADCVAAFDAERLSSMSQRRLALRAHFGQRKSDHDTPFLNRTCAKPISFRLSSNWMIVCGASSYTPVARRRGIFTRRNSSRKAAMIGTGAAFGHGAEATPRPCQAQSGCRSARSRTRL